jgi:hypothetical protein
MASWSSSMALPNFMKIHRSVQKLLVGQTHRQAGDLISILSFLESRLKKKREKRIHLFNINSVPVTRKFEGKRTLHYEYSKVSSRHICISHAHTNVRPV